MLHYSGTSLQIVESLDMAYNDELDKLDYPLDHLNAEQYHEDTEGEKTNGKEDLAEQVEWKNGIEDHTEETADHRTKYGAGYADQHGQQPAPEEDIQTYLKYQLAGVDVDLLALEIAEALVRSGAIDVLVVDSVAALVPKAEIEGDMGDSFVGLHARLMSQALRKLTGAISKSNCVVIFINQLREKIGVMYGNPEVTTGGRALKFYSSVRIEIRRVEHIKNGTTLMGSRTKAKVVKNKISPPFKEAEFDIMYGEGISKVGELVDVGVKLGFVQKAGAWFSMGDIRLGQGRDAAKIWFKEHPEEADKLEAKIMEKLLAAMKKEQPKDEPKKPAAPSVPAPEKKAKGAGVEIFADDFEDDEA